MIKLSGQLIFKLIPLDRETKLKQSCTVFLVGAFVFVSNSNSFKGDKGKQNTAFKDGPFEMNHLL